METKDQANIFYMYYQVIKKYRNYMENNLDKYDFKPAELDVLTFLINNRDLEVTATMIGQYRGVSKGLISKAVKDLEDKKLIRVSPSKKDKREKILSLIDLNAREIQEIKNYNDEFIEALIGDIDLKDLYKFNEISRKMMENIDKM